MIIILYLVAQTCSSIYFLYFSAMILMPEILLNTMNHQSRSIYHKMENRAVGVLSKRKVILPYELILHQPGECLLGEKRQICFRTNDPEYTSF